ncbi:MAG TPA: alpha/beta hydrolase [Acidimicrobiales bacterium]|jgi:pimeloyl-ACP methyl ester carboxylesterase
MIDDYDEFALLDDNAADAGLPPASDPAVVRRFVDVGDGRRVSALVWGSGVPDAIFLHGGAQNAHTWDTVALALSRPLVAIDLPGHGHSDWRPDGNYGVATMADDVATTIEALAPGAASLVGIGLGSPVALLTADRRRGVVSRLVMIDSASGARIPGAEARPSVAAANVGEFTGGPHEFVSFDDILERTVRYNPGRSERSLQRGILHNARRRPDGTWAWRWDPNQKRARDFAFDDLEAALDRFTGPVLLVRGGLSDIVSDEAVAAFFGRHPDSRLVNIEGAGHGVQGDRPGELAIQLNDFLTQ